MEKLSIKSLIEFRRKTERSKRTFVNNLKSDKKESDGGGDYWISSISALGNAYRLNDNQIIKDKIDEIVEKDDDKIAKKTKTMYRRNIDLLYNYEDSEFIDWKPKKDLKFLSKPKSKSILRIKGLPIQVLPTHVFSYDNNGVETIGAIWFVAKLNGFNKDELGIFTDVLQRYLVKHYSDKYVVNPEFCLTVDTIGCKDVKYSQFASGEISPLLDSTVDSINAIL